MKKDIPRLGIEPQNCKMSWFETWCLSPLDHQISIWKWLIYQYINIGKSSTKPPKYPNLVLFFCIQHISFLFIQEYVSPVGFYFVFLWHHATPYHLDDCLSHLACIMQYYFVTSNPKSWNRYLVPTTSTFYWNLHMQY